MRPFRRITTVDLWRPLAFFGAALLSALYLWASAPRAAASAPVPAAGTAAQAWAEMERAGHLTVRGNALSLVQARQRPAEQPPVTPLEPVAGEMPVPSAVDYGD